MNYPLNFCISLDLLYIHSNMTDPIQPQPVRPLHFSYTYHSPISTWTRQKYDLPDQRDTLSVLTSSSETDTEKDTELTKAESETQTKGTKRERERWVMGIDEAGRGPVLGPMVYACAYAPLSFVSTLDTLGFDDSKVLSHSTRDYLFDLFQNPNDPPSVDKGGEDSEGGYHELHYATRVLSPGDISKDMLRGIAPVNLNKQAEEATIGLIGDVLRKGIDLAECYVDALGACGPYQAKLSALFPTISFTVCPKADSLFKIVSAASIAAKITRDRWITHWIHPEENLPYRIKSNPAPLTATSTSSSGLDGTVGRKRKAAVRKGGKKKKGSAIEDDDDEEEEEDGKEEENVVVEVTVESENEVGKGEEIAMGSGYPSDPTTKSFLRQTLHPIFGYPSLVRFSWSTVKVILDKEAKHVRWTDESTNGNESKHFFRASAQDIADRERSRVWMETGLKSVGEI